jgi:hypothetical protein
MDTLSHALWGYGLFGYKRYPWLAIFFGAMPDLISFGLLILTNLMTGHWSLGKPALDYLPFWIFPAYSIGHSFIICLPIIYVIYCFNRAFAIAMLAWPFHIILDFPFHTKAFFATPIFWPLSDYKIDGVPWTYWYIWYPNILFLSLLLFYRYKKKYKKFNQ